MAVANHPLCEPVRFAHYKALVPIREVDGIVYVSGHGRKISTPMNRCTVAALAQILRWKMAITPQQNVPKPCCVPCSSGTAAWTASTTWCAPPRW